MPLEPLLIAVAAAAAIAVAATRIRAVRQVARTLLDMVDGSLGMYMVRDLLGRSTTTRRDRRIARRRAREQAELERRIGVVPSAEPRPVAVSAPTRLVVSGDPMATAGAPLGSPGRPEDAGGPVRPERAGRSAPRGRLLRDVGAVLAMGAVVVLVLVNVVGPAEGEVLAATGVPTDLPAPSAHGAPSVEATPLPAVTRVSPSPRPTTGAAATATPDATAAADPTAAAAAGPEVADLDHRLVGRTGGGRTVSVELRWGQGRPGPDGGEAATYRLEMSTDDGPFEVVPRDDPAATSLRRSLTAGRTYAFRVRAMDAADRLGPVAAWPPITPGRHQETSSLTRYTGAWRRAEGPSLSGGGVVFTRERDARVVLRFTGTDVAWIATKTPMSGRAQVRIDGELVDTVDLASRSVDYRRVVFRWHAPERGAHRLEIRALGDGRVDVDAFVVLR